MIIETVISISFANHSVDTESTNGTYSLKIPYSRADASNLQANEYSLSYIPSI